MDTQEIVKKYDFKFSKSLGQNFLKDESVLKDIIIAADINEEDFVVEIGPGVGTLTSELLKRAKKVCAIELDDELIEILNNELSSFSNFELIHDDILRVDDKDIVQSGEKIKVVANLPYYITTPVITKLIKEWESLDFMIIMIQKEVADRICALPGCKDYGALSLLVQYYCDFQMIRNVSSECFIPKPKVESSIIKLTKLSSKKVEVKDEELFFKIIRASFTQRRKTLNNSLKSLGIEKESLQQCFKTAEIDPIRRGETLSIYEFAKLSDCISNININ